VTVRQITTSRRQSEFGKLGYPSDSGLAGTRLSQKNVETAGGNSVSNAATRLLGMLALVLAGEAIFFLPFGVTRHFGPTFLEVFGVGDAELGRMQAVYGLVAALAYLVGGGFADSIQPRKLLAGSLLATGLSGLYLASIPSATGLYGLYAFWGASTIVPFWSALIRATRDWGEGREQGVAFGVLDGGRGLIAALTGLLALWLFVLCFPDGAEGATSAQRLGGMRFVIYTYTAACFLAAIAAFLLVLPSRSMSAGQAAAGFDWRNLKECFAMRTVWLQAAIVAAAYTLFKGRDFYTRYAHDVWGWTEIETAEVSTLSVWVRPVAAIGAGVLADRWRSTRVISSCFVLSAFVYVSFLLTTPAASTAALLWTNVMLSCVAIFALRGVYFAVMEEAAIPRRLTGAAVGVISFVGFLPEIFVPLIGGALVEGSQGGYATLFSLMFVASLGGLTATVTLERSLAK